MKCVLAALTLTVLVVSVLATGEKKVCACPYIYSPVCTTDNTMFPNLCTLLCDEGGKELATDKFYNRETETCEACTCTFDWRPVCDTDNTMFPNICSLNCSGAKILDESKVYNEETQQCEDA